MRFMMNESDLQWEKKLINFMLHHNELFISCGLKATSPDKQFYAHYFSYRYTVYYWQ